MIATLLAFLILMSNIGFSMNAHLCGGQIVEKSLTIGMREMDCGMENMQSNCSADNKPMQAHFKTTDCCENQHEVIALDKNVTVQAKSFNPNPTFVLSFIYLFTSPEISTQDSDNIFTQYLTPPLKRDIPVLFQSFLI